MANRIEWDREIIDCIIEQLDVPNGDAQGIFEAHPFETAQGWAIGSKPIEVAKKICQAGD